ncbi:MAG: acyl-CoA dehydratase activase-related protein [Oscillospiraceae bacterium]|nr:acyl-CoA dehydratase activase-related protein [Oscillospiraceae bacterium]
MRIGLDIGSTTMKCVVLDSQNKILYQTYDRHYSEITKKAIAMLDAIDRDILKGAPAALTISGSAGMGLAESCGIPFLQEVYSTRVAVRELAPWADVIIELGGEDAKILFMDRTAEVRMNGSCAGGTGAFIDQMASLLQVTPGEMNDLAARSEHIYTIASRCGVFAKSDVQPLINQGAHREDIAASILYAVVNQTIAGLAQGRRIEGNVLYLGGPLTFLSRLRASFDDVLGLKGVCPDNSLYFVALGAAYSGKEEQPLAQAVARLSQYRGGGKASSLPPLFRDEGEYGEFRERHGRACVPRAPLDVSRPVYLGVDAGSTTIKMALIDGEKRLVHSSYQSNSGSPVRLVREFLMGLYRDHPGLHIASAAVTGYGEELIKNAFGMDDGLVETMAHFTAAKEFMPGVDFVIDIGGQDIKCFKIKNGVIENIFLNEACSSGCGSFLQTFAGALGYEMEDFARLGLFGDAPVELGSRCTVFMNSSVKQAQKDGASLENISAGLSVSVVKNALYKVIRVSSKASLGRNIVVQGGTFYNDAVLRAFEKEMDCEAVRPDIAGLMGAYGAALYTLSRGREKSSIAGPEELAGFTHEERETQCGLCSNRCRLTVNTFSGGKKYISGNKCERPVKGKNAGTDLNLYEDKRQYIQSLIEKEPPAGKKRIGLPLGLNMYEMAPFWCAFFEELGMAPVLTGFAGRETYLLGQATIPSDTVCFPAKLLHGQVQRLLDQKVDAVFYPCMTYNFNEKKGDNHFNCPVVAYYPEVLGANIDCGGTLFINDYIDVNQRRHFVGKMTEILRRHGLEADGKAVKKAVTAAFEAQRRYREAMRSRGDEIIQRARAKGRPIVVLAGRPYHIDPEVSHGIDKLIASFGAAVVSEDAVADRVKPFATTVLNQWTYHARMYAAAHYVGGAPDMQLVQLVSFGCGVDAITTDEVREILEKEGKICTQIKIDEITNLGAVRIRLRSLFAAIEQRREPHAGTN